MLIKVTCSSAAVSDLCELHGLSLLLAKSTNAVVHGLVIHVPSFSQVWHVRLDLSHLCVPDKVCKVQNKSRIRSLALCKPSNPEYYFGKGTV